MGPDLYERLEKSLTNHSPTPDQVERIEAIREAGKRLARQISVNTPTSREQSLAATHLEETIMWAVKSIVLEEF